MSEPMMTPSTNAAAVTIQRQFLLRKSKKGVSTKSLLPKTFFVALDGSKLSFRAAKLAACLCDVRVGDKVKCVSVCAGNINAEQALALINRAENILKDGGFPPLRLEAGEVLEVDSKRNLAETLCHVAAKDADGILVMGAGGMRHEEEWKQKKKTSPTAATGSVVLECMSKCRGPVIVTKPKAYQLLDHDDFYRLRSGKLGQGAMSVTMSVVAAVSHPASMGSHQTMDIAVRLLQSGIEGDADKCTLLNIRGDTCTESQSAKMSTYWNSEAAKQGPAYSFVLEQANRRSIEKAIIEFCDKQGDKGEMLVDMVILNSAELYKPHGSALGSVSMAVAKATNANVLIAKHHLML
jgi:nucleotide-binding universal stress UspA family protein